jgi:hypothetical protein
LVAAVAAPAQVEAALRDAKQKAATVEQEFAKRVEEIFAKLPAAK